MVTVLAHPTREDAVRVYVKGAPEYILHKCSAMYNYEGQKVQMGEDELNYVNNIMSQEFTGIGLRVLSFAYKDMSVH